jgi:hypothetical protein
MNKKDMAFMVCSKEQKIVSHCMRRIIKLKNLMRIIGVIFLVIPSLFYPQQETSTPSSGVLRLPYIVACHQTYK